jgi:hypothetical protein
MRSHSCVDLHGPSASVCTLAQPGGTGPNPEELFAFLKGLGLYGAIAAVLLALGLWMLKQFAGRAFQEGGNRAAGRLASRISARRWLTSGALRRYRNAVRRNYAEHPLGFVEGGAINIREVYVPLQYLRIRDREDVYQRIRIERRAVVTGMPGAGKSLLLKNSMLLWADDRRSTNIYLPVLIELHRLNGNTASLIDVIHDEVQRNQLRRPRAFIEKALEDGVLRVLLDGLDEVGHQDQARVIQEIKDLSRQFPDGQIIVTCRTAIYYGQLAPDFAMTVQVADFDDAAIRRFLNNWPALDGPEVEQLVGGLRDNPQMLRLAASPLLLTMIAYLHTEVFAKRGSSLPNSRSEFYEVAIDHLLGRDRELSRHPSISVYNSTDKGFALQRIALVLQNASAEKADRLTIDQRAAVSTIKQILPDLNLDPEHARPMLDEIVDRSQLLVKVDRRSAEYTFRHLTLQEYLAAKEIGADGAELIRLYFADRVAWRETVKLWCGVSAIDCTEVVSRIYGSGNDFDRVLAFECMSEAKRINDEFARQMMAEMLQALQIYPRGVTAGEIAALGAVAGDSRPRGRLLLDELSRLALSSGSARDLALSALAATRHPRAAGLLATMTLYPPARRALRSMGEQALLALRDAARSGSMAAVDDIAAIGTPAATEMLVEFIWTESRVAVRAAWRLARLFSDPTVERELSTSRPTVDMAVPQLDWVWAPFKSGAGPAVQQIAGRVAYLLSVTTEEAFVEGSEIDKRFIIPLGIVNGCEQAEQKTILQPPRQLTAAVGSFLHRPGPGRRNFTDRLSQWGDLASVCVSVPPKLDRAQARSVLHAVIASRGLPPSALQIISCLGVADLATVAATIFCKPTLSVTRGHWQRVTATDANPANLRNIRNILLPAVAALIGVCSLATVVGTAIGLWEVGPRWLSFLYLAMISPAVPLTLNNYGVADWGIGDWLNDQLLRLGDRSRISLVPILYLGCSGAFAVYWFSLGLLTQVDGLTFVLLVGGVVAALLSLSIWVYVAENRSRNPLRDLLGAGSTDTGHAQSIISG